ncbi:MAG: hypothetical protein ABI600_10010, partial [Luteolibacter sp.]
MILRELCEFGHPNRVIGFHRDLKETVDGSLPIILDSVPVFDFLGMEDTAFHVEIRITHSPALLIAGVSHILGKRLVEGNIEIPLRRRPVVKLELINGLPSKIVRDEFAEQNKFCKKITYK